MPKCKTCGKEVSYYSKVCEHCNTPIELINMKYPVKEFNSDQSSFVRGLIAFIFPLVGLIMLFLSIGRYPKRTISIAKGLIFGLIMWIIFGGNIILLFF